MAETTETEPMTQTASFDHVTRGVGSGHIPTWAPPRADNSGIEIATSAPEFSLPGIDGRIHTLADYDDAEALVIIQIATICPYVRAWEGRIKAIHADYSGRNVAVVAINSNTTTEHSGADSLEGMSDRARAQGFEFDYLRDDDQSLDLVLGSMRTPEVFVFDRDRNLAYHGLIDDSHDETKVTQHYLRDALDALLTGEVPAIRDTPPAGCTLKWGTTQTKVDLSGLKAAIDGGYADNCPVALAYVGDDGKPQLTHDATVQVFESDKLSIWSPNADGELPRAIAKNPDVTLVYRMFKNRDDRAYYTFRGRARVDASVNDAVYSKLPYSEATLDPEMHGVAVIVDVESVKGSYRFLKIDSRSGPVNMVG